MLDLTFPTFSNGRLSLLKVCVFNTKEERADTLKGKMLCGSFSSVLKALPQNILENVCRLS